MGTFWYKGQTSGKKLLTLSFEKKKKKRWCRPYKIHFFKKRKLNMKGPFFRKAIFHYWFNFYPWVLSNILLNIKLLECKTHIVVNKVHQVLRFCAWCSDGYTLVRRNSTHQIHFLRSRYLRLTSEEFIYSLIYQLFNYRLIIISNSSIFTCLFWNICIYI